MRGQAFRYIGWHIIDRTGPRLLASLFIAATLCWAAGSAMGKHPPPDEQVQIVVAQLHIQLSFLFTLLFVHGIVGIDRVQGFYRFYLAKPVSPYWFYGQAIVLALVGTIAASAGYVVASSLLIKPLWVWSVVPHSVAMFAIFGMLIWLFGMVSRHDWLWAIAALLTFSMLRTAWPASESRLGKVLEAVLPPNQLIGSSVHPTALQWLWIAGWAVGLLVIGMLVMRWRSVGEA